MNLGDIVGYLVLDNPVSQALISTASAVLQNAELKSSTMLGTNYSNISLWNLTSRNYNFVRLAGLSGAVAMYMSFYGNQILEHTTEANDKTETETEAIFKRANHYHFLHTLALMAVPMTRKPALTGSMLAIGTLLFSGPLYYRAITGDRKYIHVATCGGFCLIAAWFTLIL